MYDEFQKLRASLGPILEEWPKILEDLFEGIKLETDKNKKLSYIIEHNRFKDLLSAMTFLANDDVAIDKNAKRIGTIRSELYHKSDYENVGEDILKLVEDIENQLKEEKPKMHTVVSNIKRAINMIKIGEEVIPSKTKNLLIERLNACIIKRNKLVSTPMHGIIIQLRDFKEFVHCVALLCYVQCQDCKHFMTFSGNTDCDIYAPIRCSKCKSFELASYHVKGRGEFQKLDEVAEIVDECTKPGTTRAEAFRQWQKAFEKKPKATGCGGCKMQ